MHRPVYFEILADDLEKATIFYRDIFGWQIDPPQADEKYRRITTGSDDSPGINGGLMGRHFQQGVINTIKIDSLADYILHVEAYGGKLVHGPTQIPGVGQHAYCTDPEGNFFGLLEPEAEA